MDEKYYLEKINQNFASIEHFLEADDEDPPELTDDPPELEEDETLEDSLDEEITEEESDKDDEPHEEPVDAPKDSEEEEAEEEIIEDKPKSMPKQTDAAEEDKNGVRRKKLYIAFIEWCKSHNQKNTFGSVFDKDAFHENYTFVPDKMRYFYRLANPMLCVLPGNLTFFAVAELKKINASNKQFPDLLIFAATKQDMRVYRSEDGTVHRATQDGSELKLEAQLADTFDNYIQTMIDKGDILNGPLEESVLHTESVDQVNRIIDTSGLYIDNEVTKTIPLNEENVNRYKSQLPGMKHCRTGDNIIGAIFLSKPEMKVMGYYGIDQDRMYIIALEIAPDRQGHRLGTILLRMAMQQGAELLSVDKKNEVAISMYKKNGWVICNDLGKMWEMSYGDKESDVDHLLKSTKSPEMIHQWMSGYFEYAMVDFKTGNIIPDNATYDQLCAYKVASPNKTYELKKGTCFDFTLFQKRFFDLHGIENRMYYIEDKMSNYDQPCHLFSVYKDENGEWVWFEWAWRSHEGLDGYGSIDVLLQRVVESWTKPHAEFKIGETIVRQIVDEPPMDSLTCFEFMEWCRKQTKVEIRN